MAGVSRIFVLGEGGGANSKKNHAQGIFIYPCVFIWATISNGPFLFAFRFFLPAIFWLIISPGIYSINFFGSPWVFGGVSPWLHLWVRPFPCYCAHTIYLTDKYWLVFRACIAVDVSLSVGIQGRCSNAVKQLSCHEEAVVLAQILRASALDIALVHECFVWVARVVLIGCLSETEKFITMITKITYYSVAELRGAWGKWPHGNAFGPTSPRKYFKGGQNHEIMYFYPLLMRQCCPSFLPQNQNPNAATAVLLLLLSYYQYHSTTTTNTSPSSSSSWPS